MQRVSIIVAIAQNLAIGKEQELLCYLPNDLKRFKTLTTGHSIVMGRRTFESLPNGALPNRKNVVITTNRKLSYPNTTLCHSLEEALEETQQDGEVFVIGGARVYGDALERADRLYITEIHHTFEEADTYFPAIDYTQWREVKRETMEADSRHPYSYTFVDYERV